MNDNKPDFSLDDLARQLTDAIPANLRDLGGDLQRNFKSMLQSGLDRMELVTREEFDVQADLLGRTRKTLETLDARLAELEQQLAQRKT